MFFVFLLLCCFIIALVFSPSSTNRSSDLEPHIYRSSLPPPPPSSLPLVPFTFFGENTSALPSPANSCRKAPTHVLTRCSQQLVLLSITIIDYPYHTVEHVKMREKICSRAKPFSSVWDTILVYICILRMSCYYCSLRRWGGALLPQFEKPRHQPLLLVSYHGAGVRESPSQPTGRGSNTCNLGLPVSSESLPVNRKL